MDHHQQGDRMQVLSGILKEEKWIGCSLWAALYWRAGYRLAASLQRPAADLLGSCHDWCCEHGVANVVCDKLKSLKIETRSL